MIDVSVIIVNYNTKDMIDNCLSSIYRQTVGISFEVLVSDNGSTDGSVEMIRQKYPEVIILENEFNYGFGTANNLANAISKGKYVFFLNSDTQIKNNAIKLFYDYWESSNDKLGAIGAMLTNEKGEIVHSGGAFPSYLNICVEQIRRNLINLGKIIFKLLRLDNFYRTICSMKKNSINETYGIIDYVTGADLFMKNNDDAIFDSNYFMYYEETDMQLKLSRKGCIQRIIRGPQITHLSKENDKPLVFACPRDIFNEFSKIVYSRKNLNCEAKILKALVFLDALNPWVKNEYHMQKNHYYEYLNRVENLKY